ncbi:MAG: hypothetical protein K6D55_11220 [Prevotella sp.]|nr:hypothetical protein [Prevotella sp.]
MMTVDDYLEKPYWLIDILPKQVPANSRGQYFKIERYWLQQPQFGSICSKFANLLIKLNCYYEVSVADASGAASVGLQPESIEKMLTGGDAVYMVMDSENAMFSFNGDDHYMTLYNPSKELLEFVSLLASSEGLLVWKPDSR